MDPLRSSSNHGGKILIQSPAVFDSNVKPVRKYASSKVFESSGPSTSRYGAECELDHDLLNSLNRLDIYLNTCDNKNSFDGANCYCDTQSMCDEIETKCLTVKDIMKYTAYLPYMTSRTRLSVTGDQHEDKSKDFFDDATMEHVRHKLFQLSSIDGMVTGGPPSSITFHSSIRGKRISEGGKVNILLHWSPEHIIPDTWVPEDMLHLHMEKTIPVSHLPHEALQLPEMVAIGSAGILSPPGKRKRK